MVELFKYSIKPSISDLSRAEAVKAQYGRKLEIPSRQRDTIVAMDKDFSSVLIEVSIKH